MNVLKMCRSSLGGKWQYQSVMFASRRMATYTLPTAKVSLSIDRTKLVEEFTPLVFSDGVHSATEGIDIGGECVVTDSYGTVIGRGVYNSESLYRVRLLALASESIENKVNLMSIPMSELIDYRLKQAKELRETIVGLPNSQTSVYRLVNGEGDRLSGLVIDIFNQNKIVVQSSAAWTEKNRECIESCLHHLYSSNNPSIVWLPMESRLLQEGWKNSTPSETQKHSMRVLENGISYEVTPGFGQKTGFYCDQRENRLFMRKLCRGMIA